MGSCTLQGNIYGPRLRIRNRDLHFASRAGGITNREIWSVIQSKGTEIGDLTRASWWNGQGRSRNTLQATWKLRKRRLNSNSMYSFVHLIHYGVTFQASFTGFYCIVVRYVAAFYHHYQVTVVPSSLKLHWQPNNRTQRTWKVITHLSVNVRR